MSFCSSAKTIYISAKRQKGSQEEQYLILHKDKKHLVKHQDFILFFDLSVHFSHCYSTLVTSILHHNVRQKKHEKRTVNPYFYYTCSAIQNP